MVNPSCRMYVFRSAQVKCTETLTAQGMVDLIKKDADKAVDDLF
jgi:hypothetical protein